MGRPMALNLLRRLPGGASVHVTARQRSSAEPVLDAGAQWHPTPRDVGAAAEVIVLMVPDVPAVQAVLDGPDGLLAGIDRPSVVCISSTVSADAVRSLDHHVRDVSDGMVHVVDAPVSGGEEGAVAGTLSVMVGGAAEDVARVLDVYRAVGTPVHLGMVGAGQVAKACNQIIVAAEVLALGEAAVIAERAGLDVLTMFDLLGRGYAASRVLEVKKHRFAEHDHSPSGAARFMVKDLSAATDEARRTATPTPQTDLLLQVFTDLTRRGYGDQDTAVVQAYLESSGRGGPVSDDLREVNVAIGDAEARGDHPFFDALLAPAFCMVRPDGLRFDDRAGFLAALQPGPRRRTRMESVVTFDNRAVVMCTVVKGEGADAATHRNVRTFSRPRPAAAWQLVSWVTEPVVPLP